jgi:hypothetical protein
LGWPADLTWYRLLMDWGGVTGGGAALIAGGIAYLAGRIQATATTKAAKIQAKVEQSRHHQEVDIVRKSIGLELRQMLPFVVTLHKHFKNANMDASDLESIIVYRQRSIADMSFDPIVYPAVADRIGFLRGEAVDVISIYLFIKNRESFVSRVETSNSKCYYSLNTSCHARGCISKRLQNCTGRVTQAQNGHCVRRCARRQSY